MLIFLLSVNAVGFAVMLIDKYKAKNNLWRIPERALFTVAMCGGSLGVLLGMYTVRHKTRHLRFVLGIPAILCLQVITGFLLFSNM